MLFTLVWQGSDKYRNWTAFKCPSDFQIQFCKDDLLEAFSLLRFFFSYLGARIHICIVLYYLLMGFFSVISFKAHTSLDQ